MNLDGSTAAFIAIPIVSILILVGWLAMLFYADSHPRWQGQPVREPLAPPFWQGAIPPSPRAESAAGPTGSAVPAQGSAPHEVPAPTAASLHEVPGGGPPLRWRR
jgi:hypothetical protein